MTDPQELSRRLRDEIIADALGAQAARIAELEKALTLPSDQEIRLHLGEMTVQEMRSVKAYANWRKAISK